MRPSQARIDAAVLELNRGLSHPEQVKRWAILTETLSVASGELTPNLRAPAAGRSPSVRPGGRCPVDASTKIEFHVGVAPREGAVT